MNGMFNHYVTLLWGWGDSWFMNRYGKMEGREGISYAVT